MRDNLSLDIAMSTTPARPEERISEEEKVIVLKRRKLLDEKRPTRPADEVFRRILAKKPKSDASKVS